MASSQYEGLIHVSKELWIMRSSCLEGYLDGPFPKGGNVRQLTFTSVPSLELIRELSKGNLTGERYHHPTYKERDDLVGLQQESESSLLAEFRLLDRHNFL